MAPRNSTTIPDPSPQDARDQGVIAAYEAEGFLLPDGRKDNTKLRQHIFEVLRHAKVINPKDLSPAVTRATIVATVFPALTRPDQLDGAEDAQLMLAIWNKVSSDIWGMLQPNADSAMQQLVGANLGDGYWLCRTRVTVENLDAVLVTDNAQVIEQQFLRGEASSLQRKMDQVVKNRAELIRRRPQDSRKFLLRWDKQIQSAKTSGHDVLQLAIDSATANGNGSAPEGDEPEGDEN